jgi:hypothetical protein
VEPERPDDFLLGMLAREESVLLRVIGEQAADTGRRGRGLSIPDVLDYLAKAGAPRFSTAVSNLTGEWMEQVRTVPLPRGTVRNCSSYDQPLTAPATTPRAK